MIAGHNIATSTFLALADLGFLYGLILLVYVIFSWVPRPPEPLVPVRLGAAALVDPVVRPLRGRIPSLRIGSVALDFSIIVVFIGLGIVRMVLLGLANMTATAP